MSEPVLINSNKALLRLAAINIALWLVSKGISEALAPWSLGIYVGALYIIVPALVMPFYMGIAWVCVWGFWVDASLSWPFGLSSLAWTACFTGIAFIRDRFAWPAFQEGLWIAPLMNSLLILLMGFLAKPSAVDWALYGPLLATTWMVSTVVLLILVGPILSLQLRALGLSTLAHEPSEGYGA
ncbi:MAG: hypothetical protein B7X06_01015 [Verrucomicrobia bacterium 21-51-4]|nr:MAG: hypothetical protein B7X06_01015 [Verrucomicrobia bacterium 21-51-4]HQU08825.1 hypothetical protein [Opitutales bacterium]